MLSLRDFSLEYTLYSSHKKRIPAVQNVSLDGDRGEITAILGPSGCGKTSLIHVLAGLVPPSSGQIWIDGKELSGVRPGSAVIFQDFGLLPWYTVLANTMLPLTIQGVPGKERKERAKKILQEVGLDAFMTVYPRHLSGGMKQRLAIARALVSNPDLLLMDEPFSSLDSLSRESAQDQLLEIQSKKAMTVLLVTHSIEEAVYLSQRIYIMKGRNPGTVSDIVSIASNTREKRSVPPGAFRSSPEFLDLCNRIRRLLHDS